MNSVAEADEVELNAGGERVTVIVAVRTGVPRGAVFVSGVELADGEVEVRSSSSRAAVV